MGELRLQFRAVIRLQEPEVDDFIAHSRIEPGHSCSTCTPTLGHELSSASTASASCT